MEAKKIEFNRLKTAKDLAKLMDDYWADLRQAKETGKLVAWATNSSATELLIPMDFAVFLPENFATLCAAKGVSTEFCERADEYGYPNYICDYPRNCFGMMLSGAEKSPIGPLPKPDLLLISNTPCNQLYLWFEIVSRFYNVPLVMTDVPWYHDNATSEERSAIINYGKWQ